MITCVQMSIIFNTYSSVLSDHLNFDPRRAGTTVRSYMVLERLPLVALRCSQSKGHQSPRGATGPHCFYRCQCDPLFHLVLICWGDGFKPSMPHDGCTWQAAPRASEGQAADSRRPNEGVALFLRNYDEYFGYATQ